MVLFGLIILILCFMGLHKPEARSFDNNIVIVLKPFLAIGIVLHHLHGKSIFLHEFERWGPLIVSMFFFISAYGLLYSLDARPNYMRNFAVKKVLCKLVFPMLLAFTLNLLLNENLEDFSFMEHLLNPSGPYFFSNDWFLYVLIYCYLIFMVAARFNHKREIRIAILTCGCLAIVIFAAFKGFARNWWATPLAFPVGAIYYQYERYIRNIVDGKKGLIVSIFVYFFVFACLFVCSAIFKNQLTTVLAYSLIPLLFVDCIIRVDLSSLAKNKTILFLSKISFEIYLVHGIIIDFLSKRLYLSGYILIIASIVVSLIVAVLFHEVITICRKPFEPRNSIKTSV